MNTIYNISQAIGSQCDDEESYESAFYVNEDSMSLETLNKVVTKCKNAYFYHEFKISGCSNNNRCAVLKSLLDFVDPITFISIKYKKIQDSQCSFLAKDCLDFIMKIIANKFVIHIPNSPVKLMKFEIIANAIPVDQIQIDQMNLNTNIIARMGTSNSLNLSRFCEDDSLEMYYPLYEAKVLLQVMSFAASYSPRRLILTGNHLKDANAIYPLNKSELISLDLRNNEISSLDDLECLKHFVNLKDLFLSENPICALYSTSYNYILDMKTLCRSLERLDGKTVTRIPSYQKHFFCNEESEELATQFIEHYFTLYDGSRKQLLSLYSKNAVISVSSSNISNDINTDEVDLSPYGSPKPFVVIGRVDILKLLYELPPIEHDLYSFACEVLSCTRTYASLSIKGIFRQTSQIFSFSRNFILKRKDDEFVIINDQLFVCIPNDYQIAKTFRFPKPGTFYPYFNMQYKEMENALRSITNMNSTFCQRLLDICGYDLKRTLRFFLELYKSDHIPSQAFTPECFDEKKNAASDDFSDEILTRAKESSIKVVNSQAVWSLYDKYRFSRAYNRTFSYVKDDSINRIYTKPYTSDKQKKKVPVSQTLIGIPEKKTINIQLTSVKNTNSGDARRHMDIPSSSKSSSVINSEPVRTSHPSSSSSSNLSSKRKANRWYMTNNKSKTDSDEEETSEKTIPVRYKNSKTNFRQSPRMTNYKSKTDSDKEESSEKTSPVGYKKSKSNFRQRQYMANNKSKTDSAAPVAVAASIKPNNTTPTNSITNTVPSKRKKTTNRVIVTPTLAELKTLATATPLPSPTLATASVASTSTTPVATTYYKNSKTNLRQTQTEKPSTLHDKSKTNSASNQSSEKSTKLDPREVATNIARRIRLKELRKQLEKNPILPLISSHATVPAAPVAIAAPDAIASNKPNNTTPTNSITNIVPSNRKKITNRVIVTPTLTELKTLATATTLPSATLATASVASVASTSTTAVATTSFKQQAAITVKPGESAAIKPNITTLSKSIPNTLPSKPKKKSGSLLLTPPFSVHALNLIQSQKIVQNIGMLQALSNPRPHLLASAQAQIEAEAQIQAHAQAMITMQAISRPLIPNNPWETVPHNLNRMQNSLLGLPESILGVPEVITRQDSILGVPEMLRIQSQSFTTSLSPIPKITPHIPKPNLESFNPNDFEPPDFSSTVGPPQQPSKGPGKLDDVIPPPGVDLEEYLKEHEVASISTTTVATIKHQTAIPVKPEGTAANKPNIKTYSNSITNTEPSKKKKGGGRLIMTPTLAELKIHATSTSVPAARGATAVDPPKTVKQQPSKEPRMIANVIAPPGIDFDEYLKEHEGEIGLKGLSEEKIGESEQTKKHELSSDKDTIVKDGEIKDADLHRGTKRKAESEAEDNVKSKKTDLDNETKSTSVSVGKPIQPLETHDVIIIEDEDKDSSDDLSSKSVSSKRTPEDVENPEVIRTIKKYIFEILWKMLLKTNFQPAPVLPQNQRVYLVSVTETITTHIQNMLNRKITSIPMLTSARKAKQVGMVRNLYRAIMYVINHDIFRKPTCADMMCLKGGKKEELCSPDYLPFELKLARHAIASVERKLFQNIRTSMKIREDRSLIRAYNAEKSENLFPPEDPPDEPLHKDMFEDDIMRSIYGRNSIHFYWKIVVLTLRSTFNRKLKQQFYTETLPFVLEVVDKFIRTVGQAPGADAIVLNGTEIDFLNIQNEPDQLLKAIIVGIMHVITHEILETSVCQNTSDLYLNHISIEDFNRSNICQNTVYHYSDIELLRSIRMHFIVAYRGDPVFVPPFPAPYSKALLPGLDFPE